MAKSLGGLLTYKCRRCGQCFTSGTHVPNLAFALAALCDERLMNSGFAKDNGLNNGMATTYATHTCPPMPNTPYNSESMGIGDLVGGQLDTD